MESRGAVVTGAGRGIGRALAFALAERGYQMLLADLDEAVVADVAGELDARYEAGDVTDSELWGRLAHCYGDPHILCLNAGIVGPTLGVPWDVPAAEWDRVLAVNLGGVVNGLRTFVAPMLASRRTRHILITASLAGVLTFATGGAYAASKHAVIAVAEQAALALADSNVHVTVLCPALVRSGMSNIGVEPELVAQRAVTALDEQLFAVIDPEWQPALAERATALAKGRQPCLPTPTAS
jgi:1-deoxy-11beta-hydroxypentalenate dehydrogenase